MGGLFQRVEIAMDVGVEDAPIFTCCHIKSLLFLPKWAKSSSGEERGVNGEGDGKFPLAYI